MSRRARKYHPRPVYTNAVQIAIGRAQRLNEADVTCQRLMMETALAQFCKGIDCERNWCNLADIANMAETLAGMGLGGGDDADRVVRDAQTALHDVHLRHAQRGSWTLYADEIDAMHWLVRLHCTVQLPACSNGELATAMDRTQNRLRQALAGNAPRGALVIDGGMSGASPT